MSTGPDAELRDISALIASMAAALELEDKALLRFHLDALKRRPDSPLASAVGVALGDALEMQNLLPKVPRG